MGVRAGLLAGGLVLACALGSAPGAGAVTVSLAEFSAFSQPDLGAPQAAAAGFAAGKSLTHVETFESLPAWTAGGGQGGGQGGADLAGTGAGSFTASGTPGSGASVVGAGDALQLRGDTGMRWGRYSTDGSSPGGLLDGKWLDSNDNTAMTWTISGLGKFNALGFFVTDAADAGGTFAITAGVSVFANLAGGAGELANGNVHFVGLLFDEMVDEFTLTLGHDVANDGFGLDGAMVAVAPVPLPPAAGLMLAGVALLGALGWRRHPRPGAAAA